MFYKNENGELLSAQTEVTGPDYCLKAEEHAAYAYPIGGWYWFDTEADAREFLGIPILEAK